MLMKYLLSFVVLSMAVSLGAQKVDRDELNRTGEHSVNFINYVGPHDSTDSLEEINSIGRTLGRLLAGSSTEEAEVNGKYRILHVVTPEIQEGLDADIFILDDSALVDHIDNLRSIIAGYLEEYYGFSREDAYLLAEFASYYNAVYRGDKEMVEMRYKEPVAGKLESARIGIDTHYTNWPGKTQMLIPLRDDDDASLIDTSALSEEAVIESMREEDDMALDARRQMVEMREEEMDKEQEEIDKEQQKIDEKQQKLDQRRQQTEEQAEAIEEELDIMDQKEESGQSTPADQERKEELLDNQQSLNQEQENIDQDQKAIDQEQEVVDDKKSLLDVITEEVMTMRDDIAEDENTLIAESEKQSSSSAVTKQKDTQPVWFLMVDSEADGIPFGRVIKYDLNTGERLAVSPLTSVRGRSLLLMPDSLLVIAGKEGPETQVLPMILNKDSLESQKEGINTVCPGSLMTIQNDEIYLVTEQKGEWRLGKFDTNLKLLALSETAVEPWTTLSFEGKSLYAQGKDRQVLKLSLKDLQEEVILR